MSSQYAAIHNNVTEIEYKKLCIGLPICQKLHNTVNMKNITQGELLTFK